MKLRLGTRGSDLALTQSRAVAALLQARAVAAELVVISTSGDRRPTTDRVIVYRHERTLLPALLPHADIAEPQRVHASPPLERVMVLDFPDFDSVERTHHEVLERFFPRLDVLIVLVDDVKYGDARLFELLGSTLRHPRHLGREALDVLRLFHQQALRDEEREVRIDVARGLEALVESLLHQFPDRVPVWTDDHAPLDG